MLSLFRELKQSATISFVKPSARGKRRFPQGHAQINDSLGTYKALWERSSLEALIRKYNNDFVSASKTKNPTFAKLDDSRAKQEAKDQIRRNAAMAANGTNDWNKCRTELIRKYLSAFEMQPTPRDSEVETSGNKTTSDKSTVGGVENSPPDIAHTDDDDPTFPDIEVTLSAHEASFPIEI